MESSEEGDASEDQPLHSRSDLLIGRFRCTLRCDQS